MAFINNDDYLLYIKEFLFNQLKDGLTPLQEEEIQDTAITIVKDALYSKYDIDTIFNTTGTGRPRQVVRWCVATALYFYYKRAEDAMMPDTVKDDYDEVLAILKDVSDGKKSLNLPVLQNENGLPKTKFRWGGDAPRTH